MAAAGNATYTAYSLAPKNMAIYGKVQNVTSAVESNARGNLAAGRSVSSPAEPSPGALPGPKPPVPLLPSACWTAAALASF